jgi:hypothetical protein
MRTLRESDRGYETLLSLHVSFIALSAAMVLLTDLRLLDFMPGGYSVSDIVDQLRVPKRVGFLCVATCGFLMFGMKAEEYYLNIFFRIKILLFALITIHAVLFRPLVYNRTAELDAYPKPPARARAAAILSIGLWFGVVCAGRGIGYMHPPPFSHHFTQARSRRPAKPDARGGPPAVVLTSDNIPNLLGRNLSGKKGKRDANR